MNDCLLCIPQLNDGTMPDEFKHVCEWSASKNLKINSSKSKVAIFHSKKKSLVQNSIVKCEDISYVDNFVMLGIDLQSNLSFENHINYIVKKCNKLYYCLRILNAGYSTNNY